MDGNKLMKQVAAIFSVFMVFFYLGVGIFLIFYFDKSGFRSTVPKEARVILGATLLLYGLYRGFRTYVNLNEAFFKNDDKDKFGRG